MSAKARSKVLIGAGAVAAALVIVHLTRNDAVTSPSNLPDPTQAAREALETKEETAAHFGQAMVKATMRDPESSSFHSVFGRIRHGVPAACGQVNAKNGFGGYSGLTFFVAEPETGQVILQSPQTEHAFQRAWRVNCEGRSDGTPTPPQGLFGVRWGEALAGAKLKPYDQNHQVWLLRDHQPASWLGVPIATVQFESDHGRIFGAEVIAKGTGAYDQMKAALTEAYGEPTTQMSSTGYTAWDWGRGSGLIQLSGSDDAKAVDVHLERQGR